MLIGYARVSTQDQNLDLQKDALVKDGCQEIFTDVASGAQAEREGLAQAIRFLRSRSQVGPRNSWKCRACRKPSLPKRSIQILQPCSYKHRYQGR